MTSGVGVWKDQFGGLETRFWGLEGNTEFPGADKSTVAIEQNLDAFNLPHPSHVIAQLE